MLRFLSLLVVVACLPLVLPAKILFPWQLEDAEKAPVLVTGRVMAVLKGERLPTSATGWSDETWSRIAEIEVLRRFPDSEEGRSLGRMRVRFLAYSPAVHFRSIGSPPPLPDIQAGQVLILPLHDNRNQADEPWRLTHDSGGRLVIPVRADMSNAEPPPATARAFLDRELANTLSYGGAKEVFDLADYLADQERDLALELMPLLTARVGNDRLRWAEIGSNLVATQWVPSPSVAQMLGGEVDRRSSKYRERIYLMAEVLSKLGPGTDCEALLIQAWVDEAPVNAGRTGWALRNFAEHPLTIRLLREALQRDLEGTTKVAFVLASEGHTGILPNALSSALRVVDQADATGSELQNALELLQKYGTDAEWRKLAALVGKYQAKDEIRYRFLWYGSTVSGSEPGARVLAVVMADTRRTELGARYCDEALERLEKSMKRSFGSGGTTLAARDEAIARALAWLRVRRLAD
ncbi:hypothetical protein [Paludibaculum fermentans]|uniref:Uncharacterized protein n=1 Tax=Paludibaculum fermentans TaxID=1473598 RepID=A0A7S7NT58_PALFE|nr:hypothetical protein [Paludibaculum fermentans]QOY88769.1 hypothetical protein IRI77_02045 [Paludibaculum fermentans]